MAHVKSARTRAALLLFGVAFGYVEAAVVVYLRALSEPVRQKLLPQAAKTDLFPLLDWERVKADAPETARHVPIEIVREAATIVMLLAVALLAGGREFWLPSFALLFGTWDVSFYLFLKVLLNWPPSLFTWDLLFLIPVPWTGPVLAPLLVSAGLIGSGWVAIGRRVELGAVHWMSLLAGNLAVLASFTIGSSEIMNGAMPDGFAWPLFLSGLGVAVGAFVHALNREVPASAAKANS